MSKWRAIWVTAPAHPTRTWCGSWSMPATSKPTDLLRPLKALTMSPTVPANGWPQSCASSIVSKMECQTWAAWLPTLDPKSPWGSHEAREDTLRHSPHVLQGDTIQPLGCTGFLPPDFFRKGDFIQGGWCTRHWTSMLFGKIQNGKPLSLRHMGMALPAFSPGDVELMKKFLKTSFEFDLRAPLQEPDVQAAWTNTGCLRSQSCSWSGCIHKVSSSKWQILDCNGSTLSGPIWRMSWKINWGEFKRLALADARQALCRVVSRSRKASRKESYMTCVITLPGGTSGQVCGASCTWKWEEAHHCTKFGSNPLLPLLAPQTFAAWSGLAWSLREEKTVSMPAIFVPGDANVHVWETFQRRSVQCLLLVAASLGHVHVQRPFVVATPVLDPGWSWGRAEALFRMQWIQQPSTWLHNSWWPVLQGSGGPLGFQTWATQQGVVVATHTVTHGHLSGAWEDYWFGTFGTRKELGGFAIGSRYGLSGTVPGWAQGNGGRIGHWTRFGFTGVPGPFVASDYDIPMAHCEQLGWMSHIAPLLSMKARGCKGRASHDSCWRAFSRPKGNGPARKCNLGPPGRYTVPGRTTCVKAPACSVSWDLLTFLTTLWTTYRPFSGWRGNFGTQLGWQEELILDLVAKSFQLLPWDACCQGIQDRLGPYGTDCRFGTVEGLISWNSMLHKERRSSCSAWCCKPLPHFHGFVHVSIWRLCMGNKALAKDLMKLYNFRWVHRQHAIKQHVSNVCNCHGTTALRHVKHSDGSGGSVSSKPHAFSNFGKNRLKQAMVTGTIIPCVDKKTLLVGDHDNRNPMRLNAGHSHNGRLAWAMILKPALTGVSSCKGPSIKQERINGNKWATVGLSWGPLACTCDKVLDMPSQFIVSPNRPLVVQHRSPVSNGNGLGAEGLHHGVIARIRTSHLKQTGSIKKNQWALAGATLHVRRHNGMAALVSSSARRLFTCHSGQFAGE